MEENVAELAKLAEQPDNVGQVDTADYVRELIARIDATLQTILQRRDDADANLVAAARMMQLHAYFFASMRRPQLYHEPLAVLSRQLERDLPNSDYAFQASVLRFASQHDFTQPLDAEGVRALMDQACGDLPPRQGVAFYCFVSDQLYSNGQTASAKAVLDAGLERFRGQAGWHDLFQRQFDQGHIEAPPQVAGGAFPTESFQPLTSSQPRRPSQARHGGSDSDSIFATGNEIAAMQEKLNNEVRDSLRQGIRDMRRSMAKQGVKHFEQSINGGKTVVHVRDGQPVPLP